MCVKFVYACMCDHELRYACVEESMHALTSMCAYVLHFSRCARFCECSAPASPCFNIATCYCVCALNSMYSFFWWVEELLPVHLLNARVPACVCFTRFSPVSTIFVMFVSSFTRLSLWRPYIACVHSLIWMHACDERCNLCLSVPAMLVYLTLGLTWRFPPLHSFMRFFCLSISVFHFCELLLRVCTY